MTVTFEIEGQEFMALNGGPHFTFSEAISFIVNCGTQEEIDEFWEKLSDGGEKGVCGWLKDKYGLSWQIAPSSLAEMMQAIVEMKKVDIKRLEQAYGRSNA